MQLFSESNGSAFCSILFFFPSNCIHLLFLQLYPHEVTWYTLDSMCHGSKRSSSCRHVDVREEESIVMNMYQSVHVRTWLHANTPVCIRMCVHECVQVFLSFRVSVWAVDQRTNRVTRLESSFSSLLFFFFSSLWSSLRLRALISYAGLSLIYVLCGLKRGSADILWSQSHVALCTAPYWLKCPKSLAVFCHQRVCEKHCSLSPSFGYSLV